MACRKQPKPVHQLTAAQFEKMFPDEEACKAYLVARRWPQGVCCPRCGNPAVYDLPSRKWHWQCEQCAPDGYRFSHIAGTIFENTNKSLREWYRVIHLMLTSKKGMSALQIYRYMGFGSYNTAWLMCHKVRVALMEDIDKLGGIVEVDETFVGGLAKNRHWDKRGGGGTGGIGSGKTPIVGAVSRKGNVVARVVANVNSATLTAFVREAVSHRVSLLVPINIRATIRSTRITHTRLLTMREVNMSSAQSTLKPSNASGRFSSAAWSARSTKLAANICRSMLPNSNSAIITGRMETSSERRLGDAENHADTSNCAWFRIVWDCMARVTAHAFL